MSQRRASMKVHGGSGSKGHTGTRKFTALPKTTNKPQITSLTCRVELSGHTYLDTAYARYHLFSPACGPKHLHEFLCESRWSVVQKPLSSLNQAQLELCCTSLRGEVSTKYSSSSGSDVSFSKD